ncbi:MAG: XrtA-associated tyrosine autokinase [Rhodocyclaceae bacterium]|nr:XrtA-associated tyrosine autokinase [Rhodocyclaceae bacterium]
MSLIEQAVKRLERLKQAGVDIPDGTGRRPTVEAKDADRPEPAAGGEQEVLASALAPAPEEHQSPTDVKDGGALHEPAETSREARTGVKLPPVRSGGRLVEVDLERLTELGMVTPDRPRSPIAEEYRLVKRPLLSNAQGSGAELVDNGNLIMVTSSLPGEGKSFTAINLAISMAMELDYTVLLVDADVSKPSILDVLGVPAAKGLMDVLVGQESDLGNVLLRTNVEKLSILPAGMSQPNATELLASEGMVRLVEEIATRYPDRVVVFDSPPLLVTTEARALATHMGQIVLVVEANRTTFGVVRQALATIEQCPVKMTVLNKAADATTGYGYAYGYGYGYGYGSPGASSAKAA